MEKYFVPHRRIPDGRWKLLPEYRSARQVYLPIVEPPIAVPRTLHHHLSPLLGYQWCMGESTGIGSRIIYHHSLYAGALFQKA